MTTGLTFRLLRIPFRAQIWFAVTLVLFNLDRLNPWVNNPLYYTTYFFTGMVVLGVVIIVHELGHCLAYRRFGQEPSVLLWGLGQTFGETHLPPRKKLLVTGAGVLFAPLTVGLLGYLLRTFVFTGPAFPEMRSLPANIAVDMMLYTFIWTLINLLPILPLDGGHAVEAALEWRHGEPRKQTAHMVSVVAGGIAGLLGLIILQSAGILLFCWILAAMNFIPIYQERTGTVLPFGFPDEDNPPPGMEGSGRERNVVSMEKARKKRDRRSPAELVKAGYEALERREYKAALRIADRLRSKRMNAELDRWTAELAAFAWLGDRNPVKAEEAIAPLVGNGRLSTPLAAVMAIAGKRTEEGLRLMVQCMVQEPEGGPKLIAVDLFAEYGMTHRLARDLVDQPGGKGFEAAVALEGMLHRLHRTQDASTVSDVILLG
jgi:stage IV sporulation protein FB